MRQWEPNHRVHTGRSSNGVGDVDWYIGDASRRRWPWTTAPLTLETLGHRPSPGEHTVGRDADHGMRLLRFYSVFFGVAGLFGVTMSVVPVVPLHVMWVPALGSEPAARLALGLMSSCWVVASVGLYRGLRSVWIGFVVYFTLGSIWAAVRFLAGPLLSDGGRLRLILPLVWTVFMTTFIYYAGRDAFSSRHTDADASPNPGAERAKND